MQAEDRDRSSNSDHLKQNSQVTTFQVWLIHRSHFREDSHSFHKPSPVSRGWKHSGCAEEHPVGWEGCWEVSTWGKRLSTLLCLGRLLFPNASGSCSLMGQSQVGLKRGLIVLLCSQGPWWLELAVAGSRSPNDSMVGHTEIASPFGLVSGSLW